MKKKLLIPLLSALIGTLLMAAPVFADDSCQFTDVKDARLDLCTQMRTYKHEVQHINNADFDSMIPADQLEAARHTD